MSNHQYKIALTHALLAGTSLWCFYKYYENSWKYAFGSFGVICVNSFIGMWKYGNPDYGDSVEGLYDVTSMTASMFAIAGVATDVYIHQSVQFEIAVAHCLLPLIPFAMYFFNDDRDYGLIDLVNLAEVASVATISAMHENYYGLAAAASYAVNHFYFRKHDVGEVPQQIMYNLGMCFFCFFSLRTLQGGAGM